MSGPMIAIDNLVVRHGKRKAIEWRPSPSFAMDFRASNARITAPTLVVVGDEDVATVPAKAERIAAAISGAQLIRIRGAGHSSSVEQPAAVVEAIVGWMRKLAR